MKRLITKNILSYRSITNSTISLMIGIFGGQLINLIAMPLITRLYSPSDVGIFSLILSYSSIIVIFMTLYLEKAIVIVNNDIERKELSKLIIFISSTLAIILIVIILIINAFVKIDILRYFELILLSYFIAINQLIYSILNSNKKYGNMGLSRIIIPTFFAIFGVLIFPIFLSVNNYSGLIFSQIMGYFISLLLMIIYSKSMLKDLRDIKVYKKMKNTLSEYKEYPLYSAPHTLLDLVANNVVFWFITYIYGAHYLGLFSFTIRLLKAPLSIIGASLSQSFIKDLSIDFESKNFTMMKKRYIKMVASLTLFSLIIFVPIIIYGDGIFQLLFGNSWAESGKIASIISFWLIINFIGSPIVASYLVFKKQKIAFRFSISQNVFLFFIMVISFTLNLEFYTFLIIYTCVNLFNNFIFYWWISKLILKKR